MNIGCDDLMEEEELSFRKQSNVSDLKKSNSLKFMKISIIISIVILLLRFGLNILHNYYFYFTSRDKTGEGFSYFSAIQFGMFLIGLLFVGLGMREIGVIDPEEKKRLSFTGFIIGLIAGPITVIIAVIIYAIVNHFGTTPLEAIVVASVLIEITVMTVLSFIAGSLWNKITTGKKYPTLITSYLLIPVMLGVIITVILIFVAKFQGESILILDSNVLQIGTSNYLRIYVGLILSYAVVTIGILVELLTRILIWRTRNKKQMF